jgi:hypothetical protein
MVKDLAGSPSVAQGLFLNSDEPYQRKKKRRVHFGLLSERGEIDAGILLF